MTIGEKIKIARKLKGITQKELGFLVKLSDDRIRQYEANIRTPKHSQLLVFAQALGVPIEFFNESALNSTTEIMHILFELEQLRGLTVQRIGDSYALVFEDKELNSMIGYWYNQIEKMKHEKDVDSEGKNKEEIEKKYLAWKVRYPESMLDEMASKLRAKRKELARDDKNNDIE